MLVEHYVNLQGYAGEIIFKALRCANCGEFIDHMVLANRLKPVTHPLDGPRKRKFAQRMDHNRSAGGRPNNPRQNGRRTTEHH